MAAEHRAHTTWEGDLQSGSGVFTLGAALPGRRRDLQRARGGRIGGHEPGGADRGSALDLLLDGALRRPRPGGDSAEEARDHVVSTFEGGAGITKLAITVRGDVSGMDEDAFREAAEQAKENCPVSKALKGNVELTVDAALA